MISRFVINFNELSTIKNIISKKIYLCIDKESKIVSELKKTELFFKKSCFNSNMLLYLFKVK